MLHKALLVARREFTENLRTRTFWIGILALPVALVFSIGIQVLFFRARDARHYAVVDHSGWLSEAVEARAGAKDLERVLAAAVRAERMPGGAKAFPEPVRALGAELAVAFPAAPATPSLPTATTRDPQAAREAALTLGLDPRLSKLLPLLGARAFGLHAEDSQLEAALGSAEAATRISALLPALAAWYRDLSADQASELGLELARGRFVRSHADGDVEAELARAVASGRLFAYFVVPADPAGSLEPVRYASKNLTDGDLRSWFSDLADDAVRDRRLEQRQISPEVAAWVQQSLAFESRKVGEGGEIEEVATADRARQWAPMAFTYLLWFAVFLVANMLLTSTIEEKSNRIMEVLLSSVSPVELLTGKILGIAASGLTMISAWLSFFLGVAWLVPLLFSFKLPVNLSVVAGDPRLLGSFVIYFVLGYLLYAALLAAIGSVCNTLREAQNLMTPITLLLMVPIFGMVPISQDPNGSLARALSYFPPFTPFVMMNRAAGPPSWLEYVVTTVLLALAAALALWGGAKIFRVGILATGKPPRLGEILRWLRAPVGQVRLEQSPEQKGQP
ncbi:MAG TPA: ABC transporter permease [Thermoanaerobaculia bacterium]|nr:ABC transporter permease [Thermoanaerobaculia bacterium]